jgi:hypothetical protein
MNGKGTAIRSVEQIALGMTSANTAGLPGGTFVLLAVSELNVKLKRVNL